MRAHVQDTGHQHQHRFIPFPHHTRSSCTSLFNLVQSNHEEVAGNGNSSSAGMTAHAAGCMLPLSVFK